MLLWYELNFCGILNKARTRRQTMAYILKYSKTIRQNTKGFHKEGKHTV